MRPAVSRVATTGVCVLLAALVGCGESISPFTPVPGTESSLLLGDDVLSGLSAPVTGHEDSVRVFSFDLSQDPMVLDDTYTDVEVRYHTPSSCDEEVEVFDRAAGVWRQIGFGPPTGFGCFAAVSQRAHLLSHRGLRARDCLGDERTLLVRGLIPVTAAPTARAVRLRDGYRVVPIVDREATGASGLAYDGRSFWTIGAHRTLFRVSTSGLIVGRRTIAYTDHPPVLVGVATDRYTVWVGQQGGRELLVFSPRMLLDEVLPLGVDGLSGFSWTGEDLYYSSNSYTTSTGESRTLARLHPAPRFIGSAWRGIDSLTVAPSGNDAFAWIGGERLAVAGDSTIDIITSRGDLLGSYPLPFTGVSGMVWDGATLWLLHHGVVSGSVILGYSDPVLTPLRMPDLIAQN